MPISKAIRQILLLLHFAFIIQLFTSCSVKEDRSECPCTLTLDLSQMMIGQTVTIIGFSGNSTFERTINISEEDSVIKERVTKGKVHLCAYSGIADMVSNKASLLIPTGEQCDPVYMTSYDILCEGESKVDTIKLHKQYADVTVKFTDSVDQEFPYSICVKGKISGIDIYSLDPTIGDFEFKPQPEGGFGREFRFRVPRQIDDSLCIEIWNSLSLLSTLDIGKEIEKNGFDWDKKNLDDVSIDIDYSHSEMHLQIFDWEKSFDKDVTI
ncbi:MAG: hypothetical protein MJZ16_01060 [Bacteroidales bacterium]|nr:hypothetical protein [Bacteroidales bacterium]